VYPQTMSTDLSKLGDLRGLCNARGLSLANTFDWEIVRS
jgi:hypothetical protein